MNDTFHPDFGSIQGLADYIRNRDTIHDGSDFLRGLDDYLKKNGANLSDDSKPEESKKDDASTRMRHDFDFLYGLDEYLEAGMTRDTLYVIAKEYLEDAFYVGDIVEYFNAHNEVSTMRDSYSYKGDLTDSSRTTNH